MIAFIVPWCEKSGAISLASVSGSYDRQAGRQQPDEITVDLKIQLITLLVFLQFL